MSGNVYGKGALDPRPPKTGLFNRVHPGITAAVALGMVAAFALGWLVWRGASEPGELRDINEAANQPAAPVASTPSAAPASEAPAELATGPHRLESLASPSSMMSNVDGLAVITANAPALEVVEGLADPACFSFQDGDRFMRHSGYRLRFDTSDDSDLFRQDATFCPEEGAEPGTVTLRSVNYPDHVVHHRNVELWIDESDNSDDFAESSSFTIHRG
ncbi:hypothetical protein J2S43_001305 [Catenuloplanes nepalensis]|uniref:Alpha-L-arabinofuranosidase B arabinose-binding domain-containing protein n=1 Tax=Catenuloplanes nepalensis TaxID=587533 RepID=A0ABT9MN27_9ACTN|nr:AbfB domain-containing protein [Catenuloplanes nepalensis]MDP9792793.1 hypothetical protein [Catenuloplanes nepalensis]